MTTRKYVLLIGVFSLVAAGIISARWLRQPKTLAHGCFHQVAHQAAGCALLIRQSSGDLALEMTDLTVSPSPDLEVLLTSADDAFENETVKQANRLSLGQPRFGVPYQKFAIPDGTNISEFHSVTIWNTRHEVNFTTAPLQGE